MIDINYEITRLVAYGVNRDLLHLEDRWYAVNRLLAVLGLTEYQPTEVPVERLRSPAPILENILDWAAQNGVLEQNSPVYRDLLDTELMNCLMPRPSEIVSQFRTLYSVDAKAATDYYYRVSRDSNYIRTDRIAKNEQWTTPTRYGDLIITINLSKPEKDPKAIAAARKLPASGYPKCQLCRETEGYRGTVAQPPRGNHRLIPFPLCGEQWYLQYSPYVYYNEHCILLNEQHVPMRITSKTFERLLEFVRLVPHYFLGSNADLPIVGGSILSHDHFQGGNFEFPMAKAPVYQKICFSGYEEIQAGLVEWPLSVIRLRSSDQDRLAKLANHILNAWRGYSDRQAEILAFSDQTPHNTITPIARMRDGQFELDLVLRNNRTSPEHPLGIFHPHAQYHHIKKENIGLIEVMGLAILPARLKEELGRLEYYLLHPEQEQAMLQEEPLRKHLPWYRELLAKEYTEETVHDLLCREVGQIFCRILENAGVFSSDAAGKEAFMRFVQYVNQQ